MAEPVLGLFPGRPLAHWTTLIWMVLGPLYKYFGHVIGMPVRLVFLAVQCSGQYIWHSWIPKVPGIQPAQHSVPVLGMEPVTVWCPSVEAASSFTYKIAKKSPFPNTSLAHITSAYGATEFLPALQLFLNKHMPGSLKPNQIILIFIMRSPFYYHQSLM